MTPPGPTTGRDPETSPPDGLRPSAEKENSPYGAAAADEDYTRTRGTLSFAVGELQKTVSVPILDNALDEGEETFTLKLMNPQGAAIADGEATGTIEKSDPL